MRIKTGRISVYLAPGLKQKAEDLAKAESRSVNNLIEHLLQQAVEAQMESNKGVHEIDPLVGRDMV